MPSEKERAIVEELSKLVLDITMLTLPPQLPVGYETIMSLQTLRANLISTRDFLLAASNGDLSKPVPFRGFIGGALKTLQANLKHLTWQTQMIASGDFTQRVEFMGEFSQSFNAMVTKLDETLRELVRKEAKLRVTNEDLVKEISIREQTETALRRSEEALRQLAITDPLTGLFNRRHFYELAAVEMSKHLRYSRPLSVMMLDIDFFKRVNDTYGHAAGDEVLKMVAGTIKETLRITDIPARFGGEEFVVFLPETSASEAAGVAERLRKQIEGTVVQAAGIPISITASFGVSDRADKAVSKPVEMLLAEFISDADQALYASKSAGRNLVTIFDPHAEPIR